MAQPRPRVEVVCLSHSPAMTRDTAREHAPLFRRGAETVADAIAAYDPDLIIYFGPDHRRALTTVLPCFTVVESARGYGDWDTPTTSYDIPCEWSRALVDYLLGCDIDVAVAPELRLDHGFALSMCQLVGTLDAVPTIPIVVNCVGSPKASMRRVAQLGRAVAGFIASQLPQSTRVLVLASGGLSHSPPTLVPGFAQMLEDAQAALIVRSRELIAAAWDDHFLAQLAGPDWRQLEAMTDADIAVAGPGGHEIRTWLAGAASGDRPLMRVAYEPVPAWITGMAVAATANLMNPAP